MSRQDLIAQVAHPTPSKIIFLVIDGLGGLPHPDTGKSELETADTPNLDSLASQAMCGLTDPVAPWNHSRQRSQATLPSSGTTRSNT